VVQRRCSTYMTGGSSHHHHADGRPCAVRTADALIPSISLAVDIEFVKLNRTLIRRPGDQQPGPPNVTQAITSFIRPACQHADPDACQLPTTKHLAQAIGAAPEPASAAVHPHAEPLPPGAR
jgi:hypothetical protein